MQDRVRIDVWGLLLPPFALRGKSAPIVYVLIVLILTKIHIITEHGKIPLSRDLVRPTWMPLLRNLPPPCPAKLPAPLSVVLLKSLHIKLLCYAVTQASERVWNHWSFTTEMSSFFSEKKYWCLNFCSGESVHCSGCLKSMVSSFYKLGKHKTLRSL